MPTALPLTGALSELSGTVNAKQAGQADFHAVEAGETLQVNGQVQTGEDGRIRIDFSSGTSLRVAPAFNAGNEPICSASTFAFSKLASPILLPPNNNDKKLFCTYEFAQWTNPNAPCYCDSHNPAPYCSGGGQ